MWPAANDVACALERKQNVVDVHRLRQVSDPGVFRSELRATKGGDEYQSYLWTPRSLLACRVELRPSEHLNVEHHERGYVLLRRGDGFVVVGRASYRVPSFTKRAHEATAKDLIVIDDENRKWAGYAVRHR